MNFRSGKFWSSVLVLLCLAFAGGLYADEAVLSYSFRETHEGIAPDLSGSGRHGGIEGEVEVLPEGMRFTGEGALVIPEAEPANVGRGGFAVEVVIELEPEADWAVSEDGIAYILVAAYEEDGRAWNMGLRDGSFLTFSVRGAGGSWRQRPMSGRELPAGEPVHIVGARDPEGRVDLYINGRRQFFGHRDTTVADINLENNIHISVGARMPEYGRPARGVIVREMRFYARSPEGEDDPVVKRGREYVSLAASRVVRVENPYRNVEWDNVEQHKANFHAHTRVHKLEDDGTAVPRPWGETDAAWEESEGVIYGSDGSHMPAEVIDAYHEYGFTVLALADHDPTDYSPLHLDYSEKTTYPWTLWDRDPDRLGMIAIEGKELSHPMQGPHRLSLFNDLGRGSASLPDNFRKITERGGLAVLAHPSRMGPSVDEYIEWAGEFPVLIGMEVYSRTKYNDQPFWDAVLTETMPGLRVWGFSNDDMHSLNQLGTNANMLLLPRFDKESVRNCVENGEFYFVYDPEGNDISRHVPRLAAPLINRITVSDGFIRIEHENCDSVQWISEGLVVHTGDELPLDTPGLGGYVRARLLGDNGGSSYTQPFGLFHEVE